MKLYLVRHGDSLPKEVDPDRPLSERGRTEVDRIASFLRGAGVRVASTMHSGKKRAQQTADLLAASISAGASKSIAGIGPLDSTDELARQLDGWQDDTMVVGHLPYMGKLVSRLVVASETATTVVFTPATVVCLERCDDGGFSIAWMLRPELLEALGPE